jgi:hypothetical protein
MPAVEGYYCVHCQQTLRVPCEVHVGPDGDWIPLGVTDEGVTVTREITDDGLTIDTTTVAYREETS